MKTLFTFFLLTVCISCFAQDSISYKTYRSVWSIIPRIGIGDKDTRSYFTTYGSMGLRREFSLGKLISLNATAAYSSAYGRFGNADLNTLAVGIGVTIYPYWLYNIIFAKIFPNYKKNEKAEKDFYFDLTPEFNLNNTKYGSAGNVSGPRFEASVGRYKLSKRLFASPRFGLHSIILSEPQLGGNRATQFNFFYLGVAFGFNPKPKNRR